MSDFNITTLNIYEVGGREFNNYKNALEYQVEVIFREIFLRVGKLADLDIAAPEGLLMPYTDLVADLLSEDYIMTEVYPNSIMGKMHEILILLRKLQKVKNNLQRIL